MPAAGLQEEEQAYDARHAAAAEQLDALKLKLGLAEAGAASASSSKRVINLTAVSGSAAERQQQQQRAMRSSLFERCDTTQQTEDAKLEAEMEAGKISTRWVGQGGGQGRGQGRVFPVPGTSHMVASSLTLLACPCCSTGLSSMRHSFAPSEPSPPACLPACTAPPCRVATEASEPADANPFDDAAVVQPSPGAWPAASTPSAQHSFKPSWSKAGKR